MCDTNVTDFIRMSTQDTRGHQYKIFKSLSKLNVRKYSFVHRCVNHWNNLPKTVVDAPSVCSFESRLDINSGQMNQQNTTISLLFQ